MSAADNTGAKQEGCSCLTRVNEGLAPHNTRVSLFFSLDDTRIGQPWPIATSQIETGRGKRKAVALLASFCPFCGTSLRRAGGGP